MPNIKGTSIVNLRNYFKKQPPEKEKELLGRLSPELQKIYLTAVTTSWTPEELQGEFYTACADIIFPNDIEPLVSLGKLIAEYTYHGVYKIFLRIPKMDFVIKRWPAIWQVHHDSGKPFYENYRDGHIELVVTGLPVLPKSTRYVICGHMLKITELVGIKSCQVVHEDRNPDAWRWLLSWKT